MRDKTLVEAHLGKLAETRGTLTETLRSDLEMIEGIMAGQAGKFADGRDMLSRALADDLAKLTETRASIDTLVSSQVEKLSQGRDILRRALEADLNKLTSARSDIDKLVEGQVDRLMAGRDALKQALAADRVIRPDLLEQSRLGLGLLAHVPSRPRVDRALEQRRIHPRDAQ